MKSCPSCGAHADDAARFCLECGFAFEGDGGPSDPWKGRMVAGRYRIERKLGDGGMGEVYLAEQVPMGRMVALKVLRQSLSDDPQQVERFKREAQAASQLSHPNTIIVHDFGQDPADGTLFIAMEFLEGAPLSDVLERAGKLDPVRAGRIMAQVCGSLSEPHRRRMIHRHPKPEALFLVQRGGTD
ncbi:MAG: protein kinase, partial [Myxococcales bacterium]|nr:protein kinase [Myxococcales bacterium]